MWGIVLIFIEFTARSAKAQAARLLETAERGLRSSSTFDCIAGIARVERLQGISRRILGFVAVRRFGETGCNALLCPGTGGGPVRIATS
jgi:hypothetical protein